MTHSSSPSKGGGGARLPTPRILAFASTGIPQAALLLATGTYLPPLYTAHVGITLVAYSLATTSVRIVDLLFDPFLGWMMDRTHGRFGRFRPWFIAGVPVAMLGVYMLLNPPTGAGVLYLATWYLVMWLGVSMLALSHASWAASLAVNYHERSRIYGWMTALGPIGSLGLLMLPFFTQGQLVLGKANSYHPVSLIILLILPLTTLLMAGFTPERPNVELTHRRFGARDYLDVIRRPTMMRLILADLALTLGPGVTGPLYNFFFGQIKGFPQKEINFLLIFYIGAALLGGIVWARVARRIGKHRTLQVSCVLYAIFQMSLMAIPRELFWPTAIGMFFVGFCVSAHILMVRAMVADYADEIRLEQGRERAGVLYAMVTTTQKLGASINVLLVFPLLQLVFHFNPRIPVNDAFALKGLQLCYLFTPIIFVFVGGAMFFGYKLDEARHAEIRKALEDRDQALAEAEAIEPAAQATSAPAAANA
ncbi:MAG: MFS transporter [Proteobacteria bacterium]|nr:MFS transporter [Pseudomonadota bacterium]